MSIETKVRTINSDSKSLYKTQQIRFSSNISFTTPSKAIDLSNLKIDQQLNPNSRKLNEVFKRFNASQIHEIETENEAADKLETWFNRQKKVTADNPTITIAEFDEERLPTEEEIDFLVGTIYPHSDISTIPIISNINKKKKSELEFDKYKKYVQDTIKSIEDLNNKPIMGTVPNLPGKPTKELIKFYLDKGINSFLIDLDGGNPISKSMRLYRILKEIKKNEMHDKCYFFAHNIGNRVNKAAKTVPAKDILGFGLGLNSLGNKHKKFVPNKQFIEFMKLNPKRKFRLFNKEDYGYWKYTSLEEIKDNYPSDSSIPYNTFKDANTPNKMQKLFNEEQMSLETNTITSVVNENPEKSIPYLKTKKNVDATDLKMVEDSIKKLA